MIRQIANKILNKRIPENTSDEILMKKTIKFIARILPIIKLKLKIKTLPKIKFCKYINESGTTGVYSHKNKTMYILQPRSIIENCDCKGYLEIFIVVALVMVHELTHYKQDIEGSYDFDSLDYINSDDYDAYKNQPIEKEAYANQDNFMNNKSDQFFIYLFEYNYLAALQYYKTKA